MLAVAAAALSSIMPDDYVLRIDTIKTADADSSFMTRVVSWKINLLIALEHPFLGGGPYASLDWGTWMTYLPTSTTLFFPTMFYAKPHAGGAQHLLSGVGRYRLRRVLLVLRHDRHGGALLLAHPADRERNPELAWAGDLARAMQVSFLVYLRRGRGAQSKLLRAGIYLDRRDLALAPDRARADRPGLGARPGTGGRPGEPRARLPAGDVANARARPGNRPGDRAGLDRGRARAADRRGTRSRTARIGARFTGAGPLLSCGRRARLSLLRWCGCACSAGSRWCRRAATRAWWAAPCPPRTAASS